MDSLIRIFVLICVFPWTQAKKEFIDFNGHVFKVPKERFVPLDDNILAQGIMYGCIALIVVFLTWLRVRDTENTVKIKYFMGQEFWKSRRILPQARSSRSFVNIQDSFVRLENQILLGKSSSCTRLSTSNDVEEHKETRVGRRLCLKRSSFSELLCKSSSSRTSTVKPSNKLGVAESETMPKPGAVTYPILQKRLFVPGYSRPQLVPQLSNWLIFPQLSGHVIGVEAPGYHAGMPVQLHLPHSIDNHKKVNVETKNIHSELTVPNVQVSKELGQKLSGLSQLEIGTSCATELDPCYKGILMPNMSPENVPSGGAREYRYKKSLDIGADCKDHQPQHHGVHGLSRVSRIMEEVRGGTLRQPVPMVLSSVALSFVAYKLFTKYGPT